MNTLPLPTVEEISFEELVALLPNDYSVHFSFVRTDGCVPDSREDARWVDGDPEYILTA